MKLRFIFPLSLLIFSALLSLFPSCGTGKIPALSEAQCLGAGMEGSIRLKAWGYDSSLKKAIEKAKRNAVQEALFKGIKAGVSGCPNTPIVPQGLEKNPDYFKEFFKEGGTYLHYVNLSGDGSILPENRIKVGRKYKVGVFVVVDHRRLKQKMQEDGLAPKLIDGF